MDGGELDEYRTAWLVLSQGFSLLEMRRWGGGGGGMRGGVGMGWVS